MTSRMKKVSFAAIAGIGLFVGAAGIAAANSGGATPSTPQRTVVTPAVQTKTTDTTAVNKTTAAGNETAVADTPEANDVPDATEANGASNTNEAPGAEDNSGTPNVGDGVNCEDGIDSATGAECDGGPAANATNDSTESGGVDAND